jgi:predicted TPR repeat methyltransferase
MTTDSKPVLPDWIYAEPRFQALKKKYKNDARACAELGLELFQAHDGRRAAEAFKTAVALDDGQALYWSNYGVVLTGLGQAEEAVGMFERSLAIDPDQSQIWLNLGNTLSQLQRYKLAEDALTMACDGPETAGEAFTARGLIRMREFKYAEAADLFGEAIKAGGVGALLHGNLGAACFQLSRIPEARAAYQAAATASPGDAGFADNLAFLTMLEGVLNGKAESAITAYAKPLTDDEVLLSALRRALLFLTTFEKKAEALALIEEWLGYYPDDMEPRYVKATLTGRKLDRAPKGFVAEHFDSLSGSFDDRFLASLDYHIPDQMAELLQEKLGSWRGDILDVGCGTGALGVKLKPMASVLTGVDLSEGMLKGAASRKIYDRLEVAEMVEFMASTKGEFDLIAAADSLIYTGALEPFFAAAAKALKPRGWLIVDVETQAEPGFSPTPHGRFRHSEDYVRAAAKGRFRTAEIRQSILRREAGASIAGAIFLFRCV